MELVRAFISSTAKRAAAITSSVPWSSLVGPPSILLWVCSLGAEGLDRLKTVLSVQDWSVTRRVLVHGWSHTVTLHSRTYRIEVFSHIKRTIIKLDHSNRVK